MTKLGVSAATTKTPYFFFQGGPKKNLRGKKNFLPVKPFYCKFANPDENFENN